eukprot:TRINITY_DN9798_c3_g2_i1.p1 TRINITY_DN9798_c3_g2~~TRINITY_DN9798_c3_g2_i1.p1  ORF type:complete len:707 (+),score=91.58 TRINITY_DN9798_c3_g2_i1:26-2146(+)
MHTHTHTHPHTHTHTQALKMVLGRVVVSALAFCCAASANPDFYKELGVPKAATITDIRRAYRKLAKKYHPDVATEDGARDIFHKVQKAYEVLSDEERRRDYDEWGLTGDEQPSEREHRKRGGRDDPFGFHWRRRRPDPIKSETVQLTDENWEYHLETNSEGTWLVQFYTDHSDEARHFAEDWDKMAADLEGFAHLGRVNADYNAQRFYRMGLNRVPAFVLFSGGQTFYFRGSTGRRALESFVSENADYEDIPMVTSSSADSFLHTDPHAVKVLYFTAQAGEQGTLTRSGAPFELVLLQQRFGSLVKFGCVDYSDAAMREKFDVKVWGSTLVVVGSADGEIHRKTGGPRPLASVEKWIHKFKHPLVPKLMRANSRTLCGAPRPHTTDATVCVVLCMGPNSDPGLSVQKSAHGRLKEVKGVRVVWVNCNAQPDVVSFFGLECPAAGQSPAVAAFSTTRPSVSVVMQPAAASDSWENDLAQWFRGVAGRLQIPATGDASSRSLPFDLADDETSSSVLARVRKLWRVVRGLASQAPVTPIMMIIAFMFMYGGGDGVRRPSARSAPAREAATQRPRPAREQQPQRQRQAAGVSPLRAGDLEKQGVSLLVSVPDSGECLRSAHLHIADFSDHRIQGLHFIGSEHTSRSLWLSVLGAPEDKVCLYALRGRSRKFSRLSEPGSGVPSQQDLGAAVAKILDGVKYEQVEAWPELS